MRISDWSSDVCSADLDAFGVQCVVVGIDSQRNPDGDWRVRSPTGGPNRMRAPGWRPLAWVIEAQRLGAGETVLNFMASGRGRGGYYPAPLAAVRVGFNRPPVRVRCRGGLGMGGARVGGK